MPPLLQVRLQFVYLSVSATRIKMINMLEILVAAVAIFVNNYYLFLPSAIFISLAVFIIVTMILITTILVSLCHSYNICCCSILNTLKSEPWAVGLLDVGRL